MESSSCHWKCHGKNLETSPWSLRGVAGDWAVELMPTSGFGGWCEGAGSARARAHTHTRARSQSWKRSRAQGDVGAHAPRTRDPPKLLPPLVTALVGWGGDREAVTRATSVAFEFRNAGGPSLRRAKVRLSCVPPAPWPQGAVTEPPVYPWPGWWWGWPAVGGNTGDWRAEQRSRAQDPRVPGPQGGAVAQPLNSATRSSRLLPRPRVASGGLSQVPERS